MCKKVRLFFLWERMRLYYFWYDIIWSLVCILYYVVVSFFFFWSIKYTIKYKYLSRFNSYYSYSYVRRERKKGRFFGIAARRGTCFLRWRELPSKCLRWCVPENTGNMVSLLISTESFTSLLWYYGLASFWDFLLCNLWSRYGQEIELLPRIKLL